MESSKNIKENENIYNLTKKIKKVTSISTNKTAKSITLTFLTKDSAYFSVIINKEKPGMITCHDDFFFISKTEAIEIITKYFTYSDFKNLIMKSGKQSMALVKNKSISFWDYAFSIFYTSGPIIDPLELFMKYENPVKQAYIWALDTIQ